MRYEKTVLLRGGGVCLLRSLTPGDTKVVLDHQIQTCGETDFLVRYPDEVTMSLQQEEEFLARQEAQGRELLMGAFLNGDLAATGGFYQAEPYDRHRHRAAFAVAVKAVYHRLGIGRALLEASVEAAKSVGYEQLELTVLSDNIRAINLYRRAGFCTFGSLERAVRYRDGRYGDQQWMVLPLTPAAEYTAPPGRSGPGQSSK